MCVCVRVCTRTCGGAPGAGFFVWCRPCAIRFFHLSSIASMAFGWRQGDIDVAFRDDHQLQQYVLTDVTSTGRVLGTGSYGSVEEVNRSSYTK